MSKKMLLADDSVVIQKLVGLSFANEDVEIVYTDNGDDAVARAREVRPDLVLADVVMPGKNGYEVCETIKQDPSLAGVPVLLLTGTFEAFDEARAQSVGADGQVTKPFEAQALVTRITEVMNNAAPPKAEVASELPIEADAVVEPASPANESEPSWAATAPSPAAHSADTPLIIPAPPAPSPASRDDDSTLPSTPGLELSPESAVLTATPSEPPALPDSYTTPPPIAEPGGNGPKDAAPIDPISALQRELTPQVGDTLSALEVDEILATGMPQGDATIFVADEDPNAQTSQSFEAAVAESSPLDELTQHAPSAPIDQDHAMGGAPTDAFEDSNPGVLYGRRAQDISNNETVVTDLDERLAASSLTAGVAEPTGSQTAASERPPLASPFGDEPVEPLDTTESDFLDIGPMSRDGEDLEFGFDVSEQQEISDAGDPLDQTFSSLMDVSESQILGTPVRPSPLMTDFDVSSSDLAANLPPSRGPQGDEPAEADSLPKKVDDALQASSESPPEEAALPESPSASGRFGAAIDIDESDPGWDSSPSEKLAVQGIADELTGNAATTVLGAAVPSANPVDAGSAPDLSPMMEQRIQEALEKVAWEAFSDLSEAIVKQVMTRVESIAWEVIPQMAETLVREEIRQMKGDEDDG